MSAHAMSSPKETRILIDCTSLRYLHTGLGQFTYHLLHEYARRGFPEGVLTAVAHPSCRSLIPEGIQWQAAHWLRRHAPRQIQSYLYPDSAVWHMTSENSRLTGVPRDAALVLTIHGLHFLDEYSQEEAGKELLRMQALVDRAAVIVTVSRFTADLVKSKLDTGRTPVVVIPNGIEQRKVEAIEPAWAPRGRFLFSVGTFFHRKNFHALVPMMKFLPPYTLVLAGDFRHPYGEVVRQTIEEEGLSGRVLMPGEISENEKHWLFAHGDAFLFPSLSEGFGIPVIEAFHYGKPVFCSRAGSLPEVGGVHAAYWDNEDPVHMANRVQTGLASEKPEASAARIAYATGFTWTAAAEKYLKIYRSLLPTT